VKFNKAQVAGRTQTQKAKGECECGKERQSDRATAQLLLMFIKFH